MKQRVEVRVGEERRDDFAALLAAAEAALGTTRHTRSVGSVTRQPRPSSTASPAHHRLNGAPEALPIEARRLGFDVVA